ncbi:hypothetical protein AWN88_00390 [Agrobacterium tumefaciens]|nr:hypothetical protein AWN88_00390 [Agrobacterium tumefaciens]KAJ32583.1 hypothetical protein BW45_19375 [Agrobacterium tumefaciens]
MTDIANNDHEVILQCWSDYADGIYDGDVSKLKSIFHPSSSMFYNGDQGIVAVPIERYFEIVANREPPAKTHARRDERLVSLAIPSPDNAVLTATILISGKSFTDQLVLIKEGSKWLIVAKTYHLDAVAQ